MPLVTIDLIENVFNADKKQELIKKVTETMVEIEGEELRPFPVSGQRFPSEDRHRSNQSLVIAGVLGYQCGKRCQKDPQSSCCCC